MEILPGFETFRAIQSSVTVKQNFLCMHPGLMNASSPRLLFMASKTTKEEEKNKNLKESLGQSFQGLEKTPEDSLYREGTLEKTFL